MRRGFYGIGIENGKKSANTGTLWRSAYIFNAAFLFTIRRRYQHQASDTVKAWRHVPMYHFEDWDAFLGALPRDCHLIGIEQDEHAQALDGFTHPERAVYVLGAEDSGLSESARKGAHRLVHIQSRLCLNVAVAGSIVMWHRQQQRQVNGLAS